MIFFADKLNDKFKKVFSNISYLFLDKFFTLILGLTVGAWVARYLGPEKYGRLNYLLSITTLFSFTVTLGMDSIIIKELSSKSRKNNLVINTGFMLRIIGSIIGVFIVNISGFVLGIHGQQRVYLFIISLILIFQSFKIIDLYFRSQISSKYVVFSHILALCFISSLRVFGIINKLNLVFFISIILIQHILIALFLYIFYKKNNNKFHLNKINKKMAKNLLKKSWPLLLSSIAVIIYMKIDQIMLGYISTEKNVGLYNVAVKLSEVPYFVSTYIMMSVYPILVKLYEQNTEKYIENKFFIYRLMSFLAFSIVIFISPLSEFIVNIIYGEDYLFAAQVMKIHLISLFWVFNGVAQSKKNIIRGFQKINMGTTIIGAIMNLILNILLIPQYGAIGAAIATVVAYAISVNFLTLIFKDTRKDSLYIIKNILFYLGIYFILIKFFIPNKLPYLNLIYMFIISLIWLYKEKDYIKKLMFVDKT
jgi:O-antigen/teichoic acid export membrane protein